MRHSVKLWRLSNAYAHGVQQVAKTLVAADVFGVASVEEGLQLGNFGIKTSNGEGRC